MSAVLSSNHHHLSLSATTRHSTSSTTDATSDASPPAYIGANVDRNTSTCISTTNRIASSASVPPPPTAPPSSSSSMTTTAMTTTTTALSKDSTATTTSTRGATSTTITTTRAGRTRTNATKTRTRTTKTLPRADAAGTVDATNTNIPPPPAAAASSTTKTPLGKRIKKLFQRSSFSSMSSSSRLLSSSRSTNPITNNNTYHYYNNRTRRRRRHSFSSATETSMKSLGTIDLNHSNSLLDDGDEEGLGLYAYDDIDKFHNCGGSCLSLLLLASSSSSSSVSCLVQGKNDDVERNHDGRQQQTATQQKEEDSRSREDVHHQSFAAEEQVLVDHSGRDCNKDDEKDYNQSSSDGNNVDETGEDESSCSKQTWMDQDPNHDNHARSSSLTKDHATTTNGFLLSSLIDNEMLYHQLSELYEEGKKQLESGIYDKAWDIQMKALAFISSYRTTIMRTATSMRDKEDDERQAEFASFCDRQEATIRYELVKIKYLHARETSHDHDDVRYQRHLSRLDDLVEDARCKVALCNYEYYTSQLRAVEESQDRSDMNQIYNKLYILHNLGSLCEKDLHRYDEALVYYRHALDIEERVLRAYRDQVPEGGQTAAVAMEEDAAVDSPRMQEKKQEGGGGGGGQEAGGGREDHITSNDDDDIAAEVDFHVYDFVQRTRCTKRKIGRIQHTGMGRFDLALLSSVST